MNFLAHGWLARAGSNDFLYGNLIADGVKGADLASWPDRVAQGIRHHRRVDAFVDGHPAVSGARARAPSPQRRYAGIALDLVWDHFLANELDLAARDELIERCYRLLGAREAPDRLEPMMPVMIRQDWLRGYADFDFTCRAVSGIGRRLTGPNQLARLIPWMQADYARLAADFRVLWGDLEAALG
ncbi:ACP phosphodiesterase [Halomonas halmophila]|uniref:ACP phosphodiesterase n=1 Tax=Halomonas halmophila TaxID=252 RepID=A0A4Y4F5V7_9GAMM|nr:ACP phosphodiesterase [Halomonas halmophila]GED22508.1 ACP phosphodiesterase [Halomonas halmophila]